MKIDLSKTLTRIMQFFSAPPKDSKTKQDPLTKESQREDETFPKSFYNDQKPK